MKVQLFAVLLVIAGSYALPRANEIVESSNGRNSVEYRIRRFIEGASIMIQRAGLDPFELERREINVDIGILDVALNAFVENVRFSGASDIRIHVLEYSFIFNRLRLDVSLPEVSLSVGDAGLEAVIGHIEVEGHVRGSLSIKSIRVAGVGHVDVNFGGEISLRSVALDCSIGPIESDISIAVQGNDYSEFVNELLNVRIPFFLEDNKDDINRSLEDILSFILNQIWSV